MKNIKEKILIFLKNKKNDLKFLFIDIKEIIINRVVEIKNLFLEIKNEINTLKKILIFFTTLIITFIYVIFVIISVILYVIWLLIIIIIYKMLRTAKLYNKIKIIKYNKWYIKFKTIYPFFIKNILFDYIRKNGFFYTYLILRFWKKKMYKEIEWKKILDFIVAVIIRIIIAATLNITVLILKTNLNLNKIINNILLYSAESKRAYVDNIINNIIYKMNLEINENIKGRRILILKNNIKINMYPKDPKKIKEFDKAIKKAINLKNKSGGVENKNENYEYKKPLINNTVNDIEKIKNKTDLIKITLNKNNNKENIYTDKEHVLKINQNIHNLKKEAEIVVCKNTYKEPKPHISGNYNVKLNNEYKSWNDFKYSETGLTNDEKIKESFRNLKLQTKINQENIEAKLSIKETKSSNVKATPEPMETNFKSKGSINNNLTTYKTKPIINQQKDIILSSNSEKITQKVHIQDKMMIESASALIVDYNTNVEFYIGGSDTLIRGKTGFKDLVDNKLERNIVTKNIIEGSNAFDNLIEKSSLSGSNEIIDTETKKELIGHIVSSIQIGKDLYPENKKKINKEKNTQDYSSEINNENFENKTDINKNLIDIINKIK